MSITELALPPNNTPMPKLRVKRLIGRMIETFSLESGIEIRSGKSLFGCAR